MTIHIKSFKCTTVSNCLDRILVWQVGLWVKALVWRPDRDHISGQHNHILPAPPARCCGVRLQKGCCTPTLTPKAQQCKTSRIRLPLLRLTRMVTMTLHTGSFDRKDTGLTKQHNSPDWNCPTSLQPRANAELSQHSKGLKDLNLEATCMKKQQISFSSLN